MQRTIRIPSLALAGALVAGLMANLAGTARGEFFEFNSTLSISNVSPAGSVVVGNGTSTVTDTTPLGTVITLNGLNSADPNFHENGNPPGTDIVFGNIAAATTPATPFEAIGFNFDFTLTLTDFATENVGGVPTGTGTIHIVGRLDGSIGAGRKVNIDQISQYATVPGSGLVTAGATQYQVALRGFVPPGTTSPGIFGAHVTAIVPEPASGLLLAIGGLAAWRVFRRRR